MVIEGAAEFRNQDGRTEGLFVAVLIERAGIDVELTASDLPT